MQYYEVLILLYAGRCLLYNMQGFKDCNSVLADYLAGWLIDLLLRTLLKLLWRSEKHLILSKRARSKKIKDGSKAIINHRSIRS